MADYLDDSGNFDVKRWAVWAQTHGFLPWQMTLREYSAFLDKDRPPLSERVHNSRLGLFGVAAVEADRLSIKQSCMIAHRRSVEHALATGMSVRPEVLAEYGLEAATSTH